LVTMILNIISNHTCSYLIFNGMHRVFILPKCCVPKLLLNFQIPLKYYTSDYTLKYTCCFGNSEPRWEQHKYMNMIFTNLHGVHLKIVILRNFPKYLLGGLENIFTQNLFSIFWRPYKMEFRVIFGRRTFRSRSQKGYSRSTFG